MRFDLGTCRPKHRCRNPFLAASPHASPRHTRLHYRTYSAPFRTVAPLPRRLRSGRRTETYTCLNRTITVSETTCWAVTAHKCTDNTVYHCMHAQANGKSVPRHFIPFAHHSRTVQKTDFLVMLFSCWQGSSLEEPVLSCHSHIVDVQSVFSPAPMIGIT